MWGVCLAFSQTRQLESNRFQPTRPVVRVFSMLLSPVIIIWKRIQIDVDIIWFWVYLKLNRGNSNQTKHASFGDTVHSIHDSAV